MLKLILKEVFPTFIYFLLFFTFSLIITLSPYISGVEAFKEGGFVENLQLLFLFTSSGLLIICSKYKQVKQVSIFMCTLYLCACVREVDSYIDKLFFHGDWIFIVLFLLLLLSIYLSRHMKLFLEQVYLFVRTRAYIYMLCGAFVTLVFSRLWGSKAFWRFISATANELYNRPLKRISEEGLESLGYAFMLIGVIDFLMYVIKSYKVKDSKI